MKKIIAFLSVFILPFTVVFAGWSWHFEQKPDIIENFWVFLRLNTRDVYTYWSEYEWSEQFVDYIILRSQDKDKLTYPDDQTNIWFTTDKETTNYTDENPLEWKTWYKLCVVSKQWDTINSDWTINLSVRCSKAIYVINDPQDNRSCLWMQQTETYTIDNEWNCKRFENPCDITDGWTPIKNWKDYPECVEISQENRSITRRNIVSSNNDYVLDFKLKQKLAGILGKLYTKIEKKYKKTSQRKKALEWLVNKIDKLKNKKKRSKKMIAMLDYLEEGIKLRIKNKYSNKDEIDEIEDLFKDI